MKRVVAYALAFSGFAAAANAGDLGNIKDPLPDTLSWHGVTLYGTVDIGFGYQSHGAPGNGQVRQGNNYNIYGAKYADSAFWGLEVHAREQSKIGLKIEEEIGGGWTAIGRFETSFNPLYGTLANGPESVLENTGIPLSRQTANGDSGRAGQFLNGVAYGGISNPAFGTLTVGRQSSLQAEAFSAYDPQGKSNAFSLLGWSSSLAGAGITESSTADNSVKYVYRYGPLHAAGLYAQGGDGRGFFGPVYGANVGGTYRGFSLDAVYQKVNAGVMLSAYTSTVLKGQIADGESWSVQGKYTLSLDGDLQDGGAGEKLTLYAGYEHISMDNSSQTRSAQYIGRTAIGGYLIGAASSSSYLSARVRHLGWAGVKYELPSGWSFAGAYYHLDQNPYQGTASTPASGSPNQQAGNLAGSFNQGSFVAGYRFNKHFDVYAGVNYSAIDGGLASGYLANGQASAVSGVRLKF